MSLESLDDTALLGRFVTASDPAAFAGLVERRRPRVLGVCRRVLRHHHDAEDATHATFLLPARHAGHTRQGNETLADTYWLLGDERMAAPLTRIVPAHAGAATR